MQIQFDKTQIADYIERKLEDAHLLTALADLKREFDFNPFDDDQDAYRGPWQELRHNSELVMQVISRAIFLVEMITLDGISLTNPQKREVVKQVLDDALRLPWYLEPLDGPLIGMLVDSGVVALTAIGWVQEIGGQSLSAKAAKTEVATELLAKDAAKDSVKARARRLAEACPR